jgi:hypothetical protein
MMRTLLVLLVACDAGTAPAPVTPPVATPVPAPVPARDAADAFAACNVAPQPAKWNHATVEPDDMICTHGDTAYSCPAGFDGRAHGCDPSTRGSIWCCR